MTLQVDLELQKLYELNKHQLSNLVFFDDEMNFFISIVDKCFLSMIKEAHIAKIQLINRQLSQLRMVKINIAKDALMHQGNLLSKIKNLLEKSHDFLKLESNRIEEELRDLNKCFKNIKKEIFSVYKNAEELVKPVL